MRIPQSLRPQRPGVVTLALFFGTTAAALTLAWRFHFGVPVTAAAIVVGVPALYLGWQGLGDRHGTSLAAIADKLADKINDQWSKEDTVRRLNDRDPLSIGWVPADPDLVDDWPSLKQLATTGVGWPAVPPEGTWATGPAGLAGEDNKLADALARVPTGRLIVLGGVGAGKTMLLLGLVLDLIARRHETGVARVPLLAPLAAWDPSRQNLYKWLATQLTTIDPSLTAQPPPDAAGDTRAEALLARGLILPVLDGLDEIPAPLQAIAIHQINTAIPPGHHFVLASRTEAYQAAVHPVGTVRETLVGAAGVTVRPLDPATVANYLREGGRDPELAARWDPVVRVLGTTAPAGEALTTPLMASLARIIYNPSPGDRLDAPGRDPSELCSTRELPTRGAVERALFNEFIPAAYRPAARSSHWTASQAERYLIFLARHLKYDLRGTTNLAWWDLQKATSPKLAGITVGLVAGLTGAILGGLGAAGHTGGFIVAFAVGAPVALAIRSRRKPDGAHAWGLVAGLAGGLAGGTLGGLAGGFKGGITDGLAAGFWVGLLGGPVGGLVGGLLGGIAAGLTGGLKAGVVGAVADGIAGGAAAGLWTGYEGRSMPADAPGWAPVGLVLGLIAGFGGGLLAGLVYGPRVGLALGVGGGAVITLVGGLAAPPADMKAEATPKSVLMRDRRTFLAVALATGLTVGVSVGITTTAEGGLFHGVEAGLAFGVGVGLAAGSVRAVWGTFIITRCWLALHRCLPLRLNSFLSDAHLRRGVLRQAGAFYQFRHEELQRYLADQPWPLRPRPVASPVAGIARADADQDGPAHGDD
jgi:hypothetical protein